MVPTAPNPSESAASAPAANVPATAPDEKGPVAGQSDGFMDFVDHRFTAYDDPTDPFYISPAARDAIIDKTAKTVEKWGLGVPAMFLASVALPASFVAGQAFTVAGAPFLTPFFGKERVENWQNFLHNRKNVELLIQRIENDLDAESDRRLRAKLEKKHNGKSASAANPPSDAAKIE